MYKKILVCGFNGKNNSSEILLDKISTEKKIYLVNSFVTSVKQLINEISINSYDYIILIGQKPKVKKLYFETQGKIKEDIIISQYNIKDIETHFKKFDHEVSISNNAGNYLCNNIYYHCLKYIKTEKLDTKAIFFHIPSIKNINNIEKLSIDFNEYLDRLKKPLLESNGFYFCIMTIF